MLHPTEKKEKRKLITIIQILDTFFCMIFFLTFLCFEIQSNVRKYSINGVAENSLHFLCNMFLEFIIVKKWIDIYSINGNT